MEEAPLSENDKASNRKFRMQTGRYFAGLGHRRLLMICASLALLSFLGLLWFHSRTRQSTLVDPAVPFYPPKDSVSLPPSLGHGSEVKPPEHHPIIEVDPLDPSFFLRGPPTRKFRGSMDRNFPFS